MAIESFFDKFPELSETELRNITILAYDGFNSPPKGKYVFLEFFCTDLDCDCRMVTILVNNEKGEIVSVLKYGWESQAYYIKWGVDDILAEEMASVSLCPLSNQSPHAEYFFEQLNTMLLQDEKYKKRIEQHYDMLRKAKRTHSKPSLKVIKVGRNDLCSCGSNKKFKKCCM